MEKTRHNDIINTASQLFKEKGYSAVTMRDLATAMGIKAASLYNHISSKQEILDAIIISLAEKFIEGMELIKNSDNTAMEKLTLLVALHVEMTLQHPQGMASLNNDWMHLDKQRSYYLQMRKNYEKDFLDIVKTGISQGDIIDIKPEIIMFSILSTLRSLYLWIPKKEDLNTTDLSQNLSRVLLSGINK